MTKKIEEIKEDDNIDMEIYNEVQRWWVAIRDNCTASIERFEDSIKLQKEIKNLADSKIEEFKD